MRKLMALVLPAVALLAVSARAADPAYVADVMKDLSVNDDQHWDERAVLAGLLARPDESSAFDADAKDALGDPALRKLFLEKWRGRLARFAGTEVNRPDVDLSKVYPNWSAMMTPEQRAYTAQRVKSMSPASRDKLIYYLKKLNDDLAASGGHVDTGFFSVDKRIIAGVTDEYRKDQSAYSGTPLAADGRRDGPGAERQLAAALASRRQPPVASPPLPPAKPAAPPAPAAAPKAVASHPAPKAPTKPQAPTKPAAPAAPQAPAIVVTNPDHGALDQARHAAEAGTGSGAVFDGGSRAGAVTPGSAVTVPSTPQSGAPVALSPATPRAPVVGAVPPVPGSPDDDFMRSVESQGSGVKPAISKAPLMTGGLGAVLGGVLGFFLGGPIGAAVGAAVGGGLGYWALHKFA